MSQEARSTYSLPSQSLSEAARHQVELTPLSGSSGFGSSSAREIKWEIPSQHFLSGKSSFIQFELGLENVTFTAAATGGSDNYLCLDQPGGASVIDRIVLADSRGKTISEVRDANVLAAVLSRGKSADWAVSVGKNMTGYSAEWDAILESDPQMVGSGLDNYTDQPAPTYASQAEVNAVTANYANKSVLNVKLDGNSGYSTPVNDRAEVVIPMDIIAGALLNSEKSLPLSFMAKSGPALQLSIFLAEPRDALVHVASAYVNTTPGTKVAARLVTALQAEYSVNNPRFCAMMVEPTNTFSAMFGDAAMKANNGTGVRLFYNNVRTYNDQISSTNHTSDLSTYEFSLNWLIGVMRPQSYINNFARHSLSYFSDASTVEFQTRLGSIVSPVQPYRLKYSSTANKRTPARRAYAQAQAVFGKVNGDSGTVLSRFDPSNVDTQKNPAFVLAANYDHEQPIDDEKATLAGYDTRANSTPLSIYIKRDSAATTPHRATFFVGSTRMISVGTDGLQVGQVA